MGVTNHLLVANAAEADAIAAHDDPSREWDGFYCQGLDKIKLVALWSLIEAGSTEDRFEQRMESVRTIQMGTNGPWVDIAPSAMVSALASLTALKEDEVAELTGALRRMEDFDAWDEDDVAGLIRSIGDQAETASLQGMTIVVYTRL